MDSDSGRTDGGRFAKGNPGGPGRPKGRGFDLQRAAQEAITPEHIGVLMKKALRMALEGNLAALRLVLERTCGRPPEAFTETPPTDLALGPLRTAADCSAAIERIGKAVTSGTCDLPTAKVMIDIVQARMKAIELNDHEARIVEIEKAASAVDLPGRNMRRL